MAYVTDTLRPASLNATWFSGLRETLRLHSARRKVYFQTLRELNAMTEKDLADIGLSSLMVNDVAREAAFAAFPKR